MSRAPLLDAETVAMRNRWVAEISEISHQQFQLQARREPSRSGMPSQIDRELTQLQDRLDELRRLYRAWLPIVPMSRCPFCNSIVSRSIDTVDLNGPWWDYYSPVRKEIGYEDRHAICFNGAVELLGAVPFYADLVQPGPQAPFVVPRILSETDVKAVLYQIPIGANRGFTVWYFAESMPEDVDLVNDWGTQTYSVRTGKSDLSGNPTFGWNEAFDLIEDYDFDLEPWIANGQLLWIRPGDSEMKLQSDIATCPYLNLSGLRKRMYIRAGEVWMGDEDIEDSSDEDESPIDDDGGIYGELDDL